MENINFKITITPILDRIVLEKHKKDVPNVELLIKELIKLNNAKYDNGEHVYSGAMILYEIGYGSCNLKTERFMVKF